MLSAVTLWVRHVSDDKKQNVVAAVSRIFAEENLHYRLYTQGGVHYLVDEEFHQTSESTLEGLADQRFGAARAALQEGLKALAPVTQSGKGLIRGVFEAVESTFLVVIGPGTADRLNRQNADKHLKPLLLERYAGVPEADDKVTRMLETFNAWVKEAHPYRHGVAFEQRHEAPLDLAVLSATTGMGFIRFLAGIGD
ncbi:hypothetical protein ASF70_07505 [Rhizobium sp. Leaf321]|nr:hypothetical protein ASF70_07505 [Rhizobium sp. Leaf321]